MGRDAGACTDACRQYAIPARARRRGYLSRLKVDPKATRRGNYESGSDYVLEYGELRFAFNEEDFAQRVEQAAVKLRFVDQGLSRGELEDLLDLAVNGEIPEPQSPLGEHINENWQELVGPPTAASSTGSAASSSAAPGSTSGSRRASSTSSSTSRPRASATSSRSGATSPSSSPKSRAGATPPTGGNPCRGSAGPPDVVPV